ncbi:MAG: outer membrane protein, partial [Planctomycetota bacterium]
QSEDLQLSRSNLELAEVLYEIGSSGPADVYRWQSRIATGRRDVLNARANVQIAEIELNRVLRRPLEQAVSIQEFESDESGQLVDARLEQYVDNSTGYMLFRDFQVADAFQSSPELASLDGAIRAQSRLLISARRAHWQPVLSLDGSLTDVFETGGAGSQDLGAFSSFIPNPESTIWSAALVGSFPLFTGGAKRSRERRARHELVRLRFQRDALTQLVEQRIRAALQLAVASFAGIRLSSQAATAAEKGLALVTDAYSSGLGSIVEVLEAQTAAVVARESAVAARFDFAVDMIGVQRAVGHFNLFQTGTSRDRWFDKLKDFEFIRGARTGR